jgi:hypothetical protein
VASADEAKQFHHLDVVGDYPHRQRDADGFESRVAVRARTVQVSANETAFLEGTGRFVRWSLVVVLYHFSALASSLPVFQKEAL